MEDYLEYYEKNKKTTLKAITFVKVLKSSNKYSLLELIPKTGRKHQLRKQLYLRGYPIVGDQKYNIKQKVNFNNQSMLLHSHKLKFIKDNKKYNYKAEPDSIFKKKHDLYLDKFFKKILFKFLLRLIAFLTPKSFKDVINLLFRPHGIIFSYFDKSLFIFIEHP